MLRITHGREDVYFLQLATVLMQYIVLEIAGRFLITLRATRGYAAVDRGVELVVEWYLCLCESRR